MEQKFLKVATKAAKEAVKIILQERDKPRIVEYKTPGDFALKADRDSEKKIMQILQKNFPNHNILTEETGKIDKNSKYTWVIDPLDGTINFWHKLPLFAVAIALLKNDEPILSVIYLPIFNEFYHAIKGKGAYCNNKRIRVSKTKNLLKGLYCGNAYQITKLKEKTGVHLARAFGCASVEFVYVATGKLTARIRLRGKDPYGAAAGSLLVLEAGGKISTATGKKFTIFSQKYVASNKLAHNKILKILKK